MHFSAHGAPDKFDLYSHNKVHGTRREASQSPHNRIKEKELTDSLFPETVRKAPSTYSGKITFDPKDTASSFQIRRDKQTMNLTMRPPTTSRLDSSPILIRPPLHTQHPRSRSASREPRPDPAPRTPSVVAITTFSPYVPPVQTRPRSCSVTRSFEDNTPTAPPSRQGSRSRPASMPPPVTRPDFEPAYDLEDNTVMFLRDLPPRPKAKTESSTRTLPRNLKQGTLTPAIRGYRDGRVSNDGVAALRNSSYRTRAETKPSAPYAKDRFVVFDLDSL